MQQVLNLFFGQCQLLLPATALSGVATSLSASLALTSLWSIRGFYSIKRSQAASYKSSANVSLLGGSVQDSNRAPATIDSTIGMR